ncbi:hypothetical protein AWK91_15215 [Listeria monocytogenes]|nr:hypothetical protein [Listeria monocytogenes]EAE2738786.1 hypothetical protein [Listeria monocytogenes]PDD93554.1 hypothetical protein AWK44_08310 [Listeria monocytogenes]PDE43909.1 hypothetical protein AWK82_11575 [Listeria monocytogenes]PDE64383.1 hypothetical protein AWK91_15215 [Listeria monocytogenes]
MSCGSCVIKGGVNDLRVVDSFFVFIRASLCQLHILFGGIHLGKVQVMPKELTSEELASLDYEVYVKLFDQSTYSLKNGIALSLLTQKEHPVSALYNLIKNIKGKDKQILAKRKSKFTKLLKTSAFYDQTPYIPRKRTKNHFPMVDQRQSIHPLNDLKHYQKSLKASRAKTVSVPLQELPFESLEKCREYLIAHGCETVLFYATKQGFSVVADPSTPLEALL